MPPRRELTYIVFDLLAFDGADLRERPLIERKEALEVLLKDAPNNLHYSRHLRGGGQDCFRAACPSNLEGIVGKRTDSPYTGIRSGDWIKLKCCKRMELVAAGYTVSDKHRVSR